MLQVNSRNGGWKVFFLAQTKKCQKRVRKQKCGFHISSVWQIVGDNYRWDSMVVAHIQRLLSSGQLGGRTCVVWLSLLSSVGQLVHKNIRSISKKCLPSSVSWACTRSGNFSDAPASLDFNHVSESLIVSNLYVIDHGSKEHQRRKKEGVLLSMKERFFFLGPTSFGEILCWMLWLGKDFPKL